MKKCDPEAFTLACERERETKRERQRGRGRETEGDLHPTAGCFLCRVWGHCNVVSRKGLR